MKYIKPVVEVVKFNSDSFIVTSGEIDYSSFGSAEAALAYACSGYNGAHANNFTCGVFGGYSSTNPPPKHAQVVLGNDAFVFVWQNNHWKKSK